MAEFQADRVSIQWMSAGDEIPETDGGMLPIQAPWLAIGVHLGQGGKVTVAYASGRAKPEIEQQVRKELEEKVAADEVTHAIRAPTAG
jgi:hypothetical protein